jgi:hypothetical protein
VAQGAIVGETTEVDIGWGRFLTFWIERFLDVQ